MLPVFLSAVLIVSLELACAHTVITYPGWRGTQSQYLIVLLTLMFNVLRRQPRHERHSS